MLLSFVLPVILIIGIILIVKSYKKKNKKVAIIQGVVLFLLIGLLANIVNEEDRSNQESIPVYEKIGVTQNEFNAIEDVFLKCGLGKVIDVDTDAFYRTSEGDPALYYLIIEGEKKPSEKGANIFIMEFKDKKVSKIVVNSYDVYQNGSVVGDVQKFLNLSIKEEIALESEVKEYIRSQLISPSSAKFSDFVWGRITQDEFVATSMVESKNAFGVELQTYFKVHYNREKNTFNIEYQ